LNYRFRVSGTDNSSSSYQFQRLSAAITTLVGQNLSSQTSGRLGLVGAGSSSTFFNLVTIDVSNPFETLKKVALSNAAYASSPVLLNIFSNVFDNATSFDGITLFVGGTITGTISVFGYKD
jgi:hypothetical protein